MRLKASPALKGLTTTIFVISRIGVKEESGASYCLAKSKGSSCSLEKLAFIAFWHHMSHSEHVMSREPREPVWDYSDLVSCSSESITTCHVVPLILEGRIYTTLQSGRYTTL